MVQTIDGEVVHQEHEPTIEELQARLAELEAQATGVSAKVQTGIERSLNGVTNGAEKPKKDDAPALLELTIDMDRMTVGDLELIDDFSTGNLQSGRQFVSFLERIIVTPGFDVRAWPINRLQELSTAVSAAIEQASNPKN